MVSHPHAEDALGARVEQRESRVGVRDYDPIAHAADDRIQHLHPLVQLGLDLLRLGLLLHDRRDVPEHDGASHQLAGRAQ